MVNKQVTLIQSIKMHFKNSKILRSYLKRAPRVRISIKTGCVVCGQNKCLDDKKLCILSRTTRGMTKLMREIKDIIIYETYRCMPLLGGEKDNAPDWEEHIVRYTVVFVKKESIS